MPSSSRIPIPFRLRLARMRRRLGPPLVFLSCAAMAVVLWTRHSEVTAFHGEVHAVRYELALLSEGRLVSLGSGRDIQPFQHVAAGQLIARLDDRPTLAAITVLQAELARSRADLRATTAQILQDRHDLERDQELTLQRLTLEVEERRLDVLDREAALAADRIDLARLEAELEQIGRLVDQRAETDFRLLIAQLRRDVLAKRIDENERTLAQAAADAVEARLRLAQLPESRSPDMDVLLEPLRASIALNERRLDELMLQAEQLEVRAPAAGMIAEVHLRPGEVALPGAPIVTLADPVSDHIVAYIPEGISLRPEVGRAVQIRPLGAKGHLITAHVVDIGSQVVLLPEHVRRDPARSEWGLPIRIELPAELAAHPGELVHVRVLR